MRFVNQIGREVGGEIKKVLEEAYKKGVAEITMSDGVIMRMLSQNGNEVQVHIDYYAALEKRRF